MTKKEAIECLNFQNEHFFGGQSEALKMAISALSENKGKPKTGHWVEENINEWSRKIFCSECGGQPPFEYVSTGDVYSASGYGIINKTKFCPNCGIKMKGGSE